MQAIHIESYHPSGKQSPASCNRKRGFVITALNHALAAKRLAHSQRSISLSVFRPYAHVVRAERFSFGLGPYSTVTLLARLRGLSTSQPRSTAM